jgi:methionyl-tRNA formyltransferase
MRVVFMGTPDFAVPSLKALIDAGYDVAGVFTQPDKPKGRGNKLMPSPVKEYAIRQGIPVFQPNRIRKDGVEDLKSLAPDLCVTAAFGQILSQEILDIPVKGTVNVHASLLPRHRGSAPINWCILMGESKTGITTMMTDKGIDTGDMLLQKETAILPDETAGELSVRLSILGAQALMETLALMKEGRCKRTPQDHGNHTYEPMLKKEMGLIDWRKGSLEIVSQVRGLDPWPGTYTSFPEGILKVVKAKAEENLSGLPGQVLAADEKQGLVLASGDGAVRIMRLQAPGGKQMDAKDYLRGHPLTPGTIWQENKE